MGPTTPTTATSLNNLAGLYYAMGQYEQALPLLQRAANILEKTLGPDHPNTRTCQANIEALRQAMGQGKGYSRGCRDCISAPRRLASSGARVEPLHHRTLANPCATSNLSEPLHPRDFWIWPFDKAAWQPPAQDLGLTASGWAGLRPAPTEGEAPRWSLPFLDPARRISQNKPRRRKKTRATRALIPVEDETDQNE